MRSPFVNQTRRKLKPELVGDWWLIGASPELDDILPERARLREDWMGRAEKNAPVDHHIVRGPDGVYHLWGCVRATSVGRILYHWESESLEASPWRPTGQIVRADKAYGESVDSGDEVIQSPFFVQNNGVTFMFYGGGSTGERESGPAGNPRARYQICLMTSQDCHSWARHRGRDGTSRVFKGPGGTRDPFVIQIGDLWYLYYCAESEESRWRSTVFLRTSKDLLNWSDPRMVHHDRDGSFMGDTAKNWVECPHVVYRDGYYYLLRTVDYYTAETHVFRSDDPADFGIGDPRDKHVCRLPVGAPELYRFDGEEYVSSNHNPPLGTQMCRLRWVEDGG
jgi:hypothetical protein